MKVGRLSGAKDRTVLLDCQRSQVIVNVNNIMDQIKKGQYMKVFGLTINLKDDPEIIKKYKQYHKNVWPEVERCVKEIGVISTRIFLLQRRLFMYMKTTDDFDAKRDFQRYLEMDEKCKEWEDLMCSFQEKVPQAKEDEWWAEMEQVY